MSCADKFTHSCLFNVEHLAYTEGLSQGLGTCQVGRLVRRPGGLPHQMLK